MIQQGPEKSQDLAFWKLHRLKGAFANETSQRDAVLTVSNAGEWNQNLETMADLFWPLIKEAYSRSDDEVDRQLQISFENVDKVFIKTDGSKILGFCCLERDKSDRSVGIIRDIIVRKELRSMGIGKDLYASLFSDPEINGIISATTTLAAEINRFAIGKTKGFESFYGTMGTGNPEVERLRALDTDYLKTTGVLAPDQSLLPPGNDGLVLTLEEYIPRLNAAEVATLPAGEIRDQGEKILELQAELDAKLGKENAPVVAGHLISIRTKRNDARRLQ